MRKFVNTLLAGAVTILAVACVFDVDRNGGTEREGDVEVVLELKTPGGFSTSGTRGLNYADENTIGTVHVLVFDDATNVLTAIQSGADITDMKDNEMTAPEGGVSGSGSFKVTLPPSKGGRKSNLVVLTNVGDFASVIAGFSVGTTEYGDAMEALNVAVAGPLYVSGGTIPMWGETGAIAIEPASQMQKINLMRAVARIDVGVGVAPTRDEETDEWVWNGQAVGGGEIPFQLVSVHVMRSNDKYAAAPAAANLSGGAAIAPTVPDGATLFSAEDSADDFRYAVEGSDIHISRKIYVPEADVKVTPGGTPGDDDHTNRMAIVVGGMYDSDDDDDYTDETIGYYRLDFAANGALMNVLRNHLYQFNISSVSGEGYPTPEEAYEANGMKMTADILDWDVTDMGNISFDGTYYFYISEHKSILNPKGETRTVYIETNIADFTMNTGGGDAELAAGNTAKKTYTADGITYTLAGPTDEKYTLTVEAPVNYFVPTIHTHDWSIVARNISKSYGVEQPSEPLPGIRAVPGVIGYYANGSRMGELTLDGDDGDDQDIVYVAYFKFGSMVAISSQNRGAFSSADIVAVPDTDDGFPYTLEEYKATVVTGTGQTAWEKIPYAVDAVNKPLKTGAEIPLEMDKGLGDPCVNYFGGDDDDDWRMPYAMENLRFVGGPRTGTTNETEWLEWRNGFGQFYYASIQYTGSDLYYGTKGKYDYYNHGGAIHAGTVADPNTGSFPVVENDKHSAFSQVLPAAEYRDRITGSLAVDQATTGYYWSSTAYGGSGNGYALRFFNNAVSSTEQTNRGALGGAIRCIIPDPLPGGDNHILYYEGETLQVGRYNTELTPEEVNVGMKRLTWADVANLAYFKFGGVVGMNYVEADFDYNPMSKIKFNPTGEQITAYGDYLDDSDNTLPNVPGFISTWWRDDGTTPLISDDEYHNLANVKIGRGDPCRLVGMTPAEIGAMTSDAELYAREAQLAAEGTGGWRLPTVKESKMFVGIHPDDPVENFYVGTFFDVTDEWFTSRHGEAVFPANTARKSIDPQLPAAGGRHGGGQFFVNKRGDFGYYWTSTAKSEHEGYYLTFSFLSQPIQRMGAANFYGSYVTSTIRCIKR